MIVKIRRKQNHTQTHTHTHTHTHAYVVYETNLAWRWFMKPHLTQHLVNLKDISKIFILSAEHKSDFKIIISLLEEYETFHRLTGSDKFGL